MFWEKPPPPRDSFLLNSCKSVSLSWNCLWYFFQKESNVCYSIVQYYIATVHQYGSLSGNLSPSLVLVSGAIWQLCGKCSCAPLNRVSPWHSWSKGSSEVSTKRFSQKFGSEALIPQWTEGLVFTRDLSPGEASSTLLTVQGVGSNIELTLLCSLPFRASPRHFNLVFFILPSQDFDRIRKGFFEQISSFAVLPVFMNDLKCPICTTHNPECLQKGRMQSFHFLDSLRRLVHLLLS